MNISRFFVDKPRIVIGSAILSAIGIYLLLDHGLVPRNYHGLRETKEELDGMKPLVEAKKQAVSEHATLKEELQQATLSVNRLREQIEQLNKSQRKGGTGYWDAFPPGHPYGPREPDDIIILYPRPQSSFSQFNWANRSIFQKIEARNVGREEPKNK